MQIDASRCSTDFYLKKDRNTRAQQTKLPQYWKLRDVMDQPYVVRK